MSSPSSSPGFQRPVGIPSFDPRQVPISGRDSHLPAVAHQAQTEQALRQRFAKPPVWQPELRGEPAFVERPVAEAAVLLPLVQRSSGLTVLLTGVVLWSSWRAMAKAERRSDALRRDRA